MAEGIEKRLEQLERRVNGISKIVSWLTRKMEEVLKHLGLGAE